MTMSKTVSWLSPASVVLLAVAAVSAQMLHGSNTKEGASQAEKATTVLNEIMKTPDKGIPHDLLDKAECVMVFPKVVKGAFIVGAQGGRGVASCRTKSGWSAPAYFEIKGGSFGLQIGGQETDFVLLIMNEGGMKSLLSDKFELGGDASVSAGPVGRTTSALIGGLRRGEPHARRCSVTRYPHNTGAQLLGGIRPGHVVV